LRVHFFELFSYFLCELSQYKSYLIYDLYFFKSIFINSYDIKVVHIYLLAYSLQYMFSTEKRKQIKKREREDTEK